MSEQYTTNVSRLHKWSPLFILIHVIRQSIIPLVAGIYTYGSYDYSELSDKTHIMVILSATAIIVFSLLQYWFYHYWMKDDKIEIKEGILFKKNRKIPYTRIQNVNVLQGPLQRFFKVATLQLESASGGKPEAVMRVVDLDVVEAMKEKVRSAANVSQPLQAGQTVEPQNTESHNHQTAQAPLLSMTTKDVVKYGFISQKGMLYGSIIFGFLAQNQAIVANVVTYLGIFYELPDFTKLSMAQGVIYVAVIGIVMFVFLQLMSILWSLVKFHQFTLFKEKDRLHASMGLISKLSATVLLKRIQLYRISENPLHKYFKARSITIETAGGVNTDQNGIVMRWLAPFISRNEIRAFISVIEPKIKLGSVDWQLIPQRAWKRVLKRSLMTLAVFTLLLVGLDQIPQISIRYYAWFIIALMIPLSYFYAKRYVKKTAYFINDDIIAFKSGIWFGKQSFVKINKVQTIEIHESPFDRRNNMATLEIDTAGSNMLLHHVKIPYLELQDAYTIRNFIQEKLKKTTFDW